jgi:hypothetical protein
MYSQSILFKQLENKKDSIYRHVQKNSGEIGMCGIRQLLQNIKLNYTVNIFYGTKKYLAGLGDRKSCFTTFTIDTGYSH